MVSASSRLRLFWRHFVNGRMGDTAFKAQLPTPDTALPGRTDSIKVSEKHDVNGNRTVPPFPEGTQMVVFGMGCFWGAERKFWTQKGVYSTQVGYCGGYTPNPTYKEVCTGRDTPRWFGLFSIQIGSVSPVFSESSGKATTRLKGCVRGTMSGRRTALLSTPTHSSSSRKLWPPKISTRRGSWFQRRGAQIENARSPRVFTRTLGTCNRRGAADRRIRPGSD
ncbi:mitochondrial peptide methionine sulfoxide reductase isoform X3 [Nothobranchius furzeri]|uniref:peptide-methionine (S)-S-oxide reductase n=1 Tax=Nothobranchius furzeri TaxID=105023 RepID=A0A9D2Z303_NOTFU|nr:transcript variant X2 [Nothobranchius furzeri]